MMKKLNYLWAVALIAIVLVALVSSANAASLAHRYDFNTTNDTVGTANGTLVGTAIIDSGALVTAGGNGAVNGQWALGNARMTLDPGAVAGITGSFTIEDWFTATTGWPKWDTVYAFSDGSDPGATDGSASYLLHAPVRGYSPWPSGIAVIGAGGATRPPVGWDLALEGIYLDTPGVHQTVLTYDGTSFSYYVDGVLSTFGSGGGPLSDPGFNLSTLTQIGLNGGSPFPDPVLSGSTYDFRIYSGALSADQVAGVYALGSDASNGAIDAAAAPEPGTIALLVAGIFGLLYTRLRKR
jgi:hypothetical protein